MDISSVSKFLSQGNKSGCCLVGCCVNIFVSSKLHVNWTSFCLPFYIRYGSLQIYLKISLLAWLFCFSAAKSSLQSSSTKTLLQLQLV